MTAPARMQLRLDGVVQGVGFRPFVFQLAAEMRLKGWVSNSASGLLIEVEGRKSELEKFLDRLRSERPPHSEIRRTDWTWLAPVGYKSFEIHASAQSGGPRALVLPDLATCPDCLREIRDSADRRFDYPFTNCTHCGPRFTIIEAVPYDRARTSMKQFTMCPACQGEYENPQDRRFHAQPNACPVCGPQLAFWNAAGETLAAGTAALDETATALRAGRIVAVKGLGGFHLMVRADQAEPVAQLRARKHRDEKPFALMFPSLEALRDVCEVSDLEAALLGSPAAPIVLLERRPTPAGATPLIHPLVAPGNPYLGAMLPSTPLHHLLLDRVGLPLVATSGNLSEEPICIDEHEARERLGGLADAFLVHNRPIVRHADDSIVRVMAGRELILRRARGYAPLPITLPESIVAPEPPPVLAVGAHLKNTVALAVGRDVFVSQHIGDLETPQAFAAFKRVIEDFESFHQVDPELVAADAHPDYLSSRYAAQSGRTVIPVQHHYAHVLACMADNGLNAPVLGVSWDGTGAGSDGTIWGGEFLAVTSQGFERVAHLRTFRLPGGEMAVREPRRSALGVLYEAFGEAAFDLPCATMASFSRTELQALRTMLRRGLNAPVTSSAGRLFDAVASILGLRQRTAFEGQAAMDLEFVAGSAHVLDSYPVRIDQARAPARWDWQPVLEGILDDLGKGLPAPVISAKFHRGLVEGVVQLAQRVGIADVVLSGGCFQNKRLVEHLIVRLRETGFTPYWHRRVPPNDGGVALGQVVAARLRNARPVSP